MKQDLVRHDMESDAAGSLLALVGTNPPAKYISGRYQTDRRSQAATPTTEISVATVSEDESFSSRFGMTRAEANNNTARCQTTDKKKKPKVLFPTLLMSVLSDPSNWDIMTFIPDGTAFVILHPEVFTSEILPKHFKMEKYTSFVRKLNRWGFQPVTDRGGSRREVYGHPLFQRGKWAMCRKMKCVKTILSRNSSAESNSRSPSPTSSPEKKSTESSSNPLLIPSDIPNANNGRREVRQHPLLDEELQKQLAFSAVLKEQIMQGKNPLATSLYSQAASPLPQEVVDNATNQVLGAAFEVLARDEEHVRNNITPSRHSPPPGQSISPSLEEIHVQNILLSTHLAAQGGMNPMAGIIGSGIPAPGMLSARNSLLGGMTQDFPLSRSIGSARNSLLGSVGVAAEQGSLLLNRQRAAGVDLLGLY